ncbi:MAG: pilus (MSHA type) biogenesis protein MshL [Gammaproteobacteria bacterium]|nr:pilus (MSHA type) biogenesis protein MshL [Gammaproteobacteria bacterium]
MAVAEMPPVKKRPPTLPKPVPRPPVETYTVVVKDVAVNDLLFSLATDAGLDLDIQGTHETPVTLNAVEQSLDNILTRIAEQADLRFSLLGRNLVVKKDAPYWHNYKVDYVNVSRNSESESGVATQIATTGGSVDEDATSGGSSGSEDGNLSRTLVKSASNTDFWQAVESGLKAIVSGGNSSSLASNVIDSANSIIVNSMAGVITARATHQQHREIQQYLDSVVASSQRQVLIEMTIVEVRLSDDFQAGVDWALLTDEAASGGDGINFESSVIGANLSTPPFVSLGFSDLDADGSGVTATVRLLQQFGDTKVLSSPKIMALNNQTALLKVVNETVYFTVELDIREATRDLPERRTFTSQLHTVPVGLVMSVTPQISQAGYVSLNIRPTISRVTGFAVDPAPRLSGADFDNLIPEIQVREIESLLKISNGRTVILGGLMQNELMNEKEGIPGLSRIPKLGSLFSYERDTLVKTELVIFLRPTVIAPGDDATAGLSVEDFYSGAPHGVGN